MDFSSFLKRPGFFLTIQGILLPLGANLRSAMVLSLIKLSGPKKPAENSDSVFCLKKKKKKKTKHDEHKKNIPKQKKKTKPNK
ncbi:hypothetical protein, partial [Helicobacter pylori]|uniref:hypothetical protein n=1 Tax=Helicobacter pylori TaxID=210 RepID=UPI0036F39620